jgi:predicted  nucleic acid-binding Zn-ribbon protein
MKLFSAMKRVGTHPHKFQFTLTVASVEFSKPVDDIVQHALGKDVALTNAQVSYLWKRGPRSASSGPQPLPASGGMALSGWGSPQTLMCTLYQDSKSGSYQDKESKINFRVGTGSTDGLKVFGVAKLNLGKYAGIENTFEDVVPLTKCKDKQAKVRFNIHAKWLKEVSAEEDSPSVAEGGDSDSFSDPEEKTEDRKAEAAASSDEKAPSPDVVVAAEHRASTSPAPPAAAAAASKPAKDDPRITILIAERDDLLKQKEKMEKLINATKVKLQKKEEEAANAATLKGERDIAVSKVNKLTDELKHLQHSSKELESKMQQVMDKLEKDVEELTEKNSALSSEKAALASQLSKIQSQVDQEKKERDSTAGEAGKQLADVRARLAKKEEEAKELASVKQERDLAVAKAAKLSDELKQLHSHIQDVEGSGAAESQTWRTKYEKISQEKMALEEQFHRLETDMSNYKSSSDSKIADLESEVASLRGLVAKKDSEISRLAEVEGSKQALDLQLAKLQDELRSHQAKTSSEINKLTSELESASSARDNFKEKFQREALEKNAIEEKLLELSSEVEKQRAQNASLQEDLNKLKEEDEEFKTEKEAELRKLKQRLLDSDSDSSRYTEKLSEMEAKVMWASERTAQLEAEKKEFDDIKQKLEEKKILAEKKKESAQKELERLQQIIGEMEVKLVNVKIELVNTVDRLSNLEMENTHLKALTSPQGGKGTVKKRH